MRSAFSAAFLALGLVGLAGCTNPNSIGVQVFGTVTVHCVRASDGSPVPNANVAAAGKAFGTDANGNATFPQVPVGPVLFVANATGLQGTQSVTIVQGANPDVTIQMQPHN
ncbi:MAG TPA: carboxypeptidase-like regulatory domain-containing protein [Candidatus Eremiobacteraceae bacterium]|jgi:hypothetical protein